MENPKIKTKVVHSQTKPAYNVVGTSLGNKYKIARIPYSVNADLSEEWNNREIDEAKNHAEFISYCFNNSDSILELFVLPKESDDDSKWLKVDYLMYLHPELNKQDAESLLSYCNSHTIHAKQCYGNGEIMYTKWKLENGR